MTRSVLPRVRWNAPAERWSLVGLSLFAVALLAAGDQAGLRWFPAPSQVLPLVAGSLLLGRAAMRVLLAVVALCALVQVLTLGLDAVRPGALGVVFLTGVTAYELARSREETGLVGLRGDSVLVELRKRLQQQGTLPRLPAGWSAEAVVSPAGGAPFAGDFVVGALTVDGCLEAALVDVSGKGVSAGTRALLLSGATGGLLGRTPGDLLPAANAYLTRQEWEEGFATAAHLLLDLRTGDFQLASAGHPPVAYFDASSGRWSLLEATGPALGLLEHASWEPVRGQLDHGDALVLYTDGLVERSGEDLDRGIDRLLGECERLVTLGFHDGAAHLLRTVAAGADDDRGVVIVRRDP